MNGNFIRTCIFFIILLQELHQVIGELDNSSTLLLVPLGKLFALDACCKSYKWIYRNLSATEYQGFPFKWSKCLGPDLQPKNTSRKLYIPEAVSWKTGLYICICTDDVKVNRTYNVQLYTPLSSPDIYPPPQHMDVKDGQVKLNCDVNFGNGDPFKPFDVIWKKRSKGDQVLDFIQRDRFRITKTNSTTNNGIYDTWINTSLIIETNRENDESTNFLCIVTYKNESNVQETKKFSTSFSFPDVTYTGGGTVAIILVLVLVTMIVFLVLVYKCRSVLYEFLHNYIPCYFHKCRGDDKKYDVLLFDEICDSRTYNTLLKALQKSGWMVASSDDIKAGRCKVPEESEQFTSSESIIICYSADILGESGIDELINLYRNTLNAAIKKFPKWYITLLCEIQVDNSDQNQCHLLEECHRNGIPCFTNHCSHDIDTIFIESIRKRLPKVTKPKWSV